MLDRRRILELIPHQGTMCLLDEVTSWTETTIACRSQSHLVPTNPLRRDGVLPATCGIEYGLQAAALHGALATGPAQPPGYLAALRSVEIMVPRLDDPAFGALQVAAEVELQQASGMIYAFVLRSAAGAPLLRGRATILLQERPS